LDGRQFHDLGCDAKKNDRGRHGGGRGDSFDQGGESVKRFPDGDDLHDVGPAAGHDKDAETDEDPVKGQVVAPPHYLEDKGEGDDEIGGGNQAIGDDARPKNLRVPGVTMTMGHEAFRIE